MVNKNEPYSYLFCQRGKIGNELFLVMYPPSFVEKLFGKLFCLQLLRRNEDYHFGDYLL